MKNINFNFNLNFGNNEAQETKSKQVTGLNPLAVLAALEASQHDGDDSPVEVRVEDVSFLDTHDDTNVSNTENTQDTNVSNTENTQEAGKQTVTQPEVEPVVPKVCRDGETTNSPGLYRGLKSGVVVLFLDPEYPKLGMVVQESTTSDNPTPKGTIKRTWKPYTDQDSWEKVDNGSVVIAFTNEA